MDDGTDLDRRPEGATDDVVAAVGALTEALETVEEARGHLYAFHRLTGKADFRAGEAAERLRAAGADELAAQLESEVVGRNVLFGRWTFQVVEEYDDGYYAALRDAETSARERLLEGRRHVHEADLKSARRSRDRSGHEPDPTGGGG